MKTPNYRVICPLCKQSMPFKKRGKCDCWECTICKTRVFVTREQQELQETLMRQEQAEIKKMESAENGKS